MRYLLLVLPIASTLLGGMLAIHLRRHLSLLIALGAGLLLGAALLDILPEAIALGADENISLPKILTLTALSFLLFQLIELGLNRLSHRLEQRLAGPNKGQSAENEPARRIMRRAGAAMLIFHSFRDGMAIGAAFAASHPAGLAVASGIAAHDLGDGLNTVLITTGGQKPARADYLFLIADAVAPFLGGLLTIWWVLSRIGSVLLLVLAAGFFLQMATRDLLPELRRAGGPKRLLIPSMLAGSAFIYLAHFLTQKVR